MTFSRIACCCTAALLLTNCNSAPDAAPAIGEAYAGPASMVVRKELDTKSAVVATLHHGEHLDITGRRRALYKVRTAKGVEGWVDGRQLLDTAQMARLRSMAEETAGLPTQGAAKSFDVMNVHAEPSRESASFIQIAAGESFDVITRRVAARIQKAPLRQLITPKPRAAPKQVNSKKASDVPLPPPPEPPAPPVDWIKLSKERGEQAEADTPPVAQDDWTLVRTAGGQSGWVLTSRVYMSIPDDVAQYAEGHRITSYFSIGTVNDKDGKHDIWLWTTVSSLGQEEDFDGYRVFTWSLNHHRYETAYIQRRIRGFLPVLAKPGEFSVCVEKTPGVNVRKEYTLTGNLVKQAAEKPCEVRADARAETGPEAEISLKEPPPQTGFVSRMIAKAKYLS